MYAVINDAGPRGAWTQKAVGATDLAHYTIYNCPNAAIADRIVQAETRLQADERDGGLTEEQRTNEQRVLDLARKFRVQA
jgi:hypothetical protein